MAEGLFFAIEKWREISREKGLSRVSVMRGETMAGLNGGIYSIVACRLDIDSGFVPIALW